MARQVSSPFTKVVVNSMRKIFPEELADKSFDNTGLLLEAPFNPNHRQKNSVLLTIDLTRAVAEEAIARKDCVIVAYHPIIFRGLKSLTLADTQQQTLLRLAVEGISVYSPHTAVDAAPGGVNDWLCDIITGKPLKTSRRTTESEGGEAKSSDLLVHKESEKLPARQAIKGTYSEPTYPEPCNVDETVSPAFIEHERSVITPVQGVEGFEDAGMGRLICFFQPQALSLLIERIGRGVGAPSGFSVAIPQGKRVEDLQIRTVGICAGSGGSLLRNCNADLLFTGELSHHEALAVIERGGAVITMFHSNTERGYLHSIMKEKLATVLREEWAEARKDEQGMKEWHEAFQDGSVSVEVSKQDRDPFGIVIKL